MRQSIRTRLIISFIGLTVIPLLLIGIIIGVQTYNVQSQQALALQNQIAKGKSQRLSAFFTGLEATLTRLSEQSGLLDAASRNQQIALSSVLNHLKPLSIKFTCSIAKGRKWQGYRALSRLRRPTLLVVPRTTRSSYHRPRMQSFTAQYKLTRFQANLSLPLAFL